MVSKEIKIGGKKIYYLESGDNNKQVLILLHAWPASSLMFEPIIDELGKKYHCIAPDFPGFGKSSPISKFSYRSASKWLKQFIKKLGMSKFYLLGVSLGGAVAITYTSQYPKDVKKLFLNSPPIRSITLRRRYSPVRHIVRRYRFIVDKLVTFAIDVNIPLLFYKYLPKYRLIDRHEILRLYSQCSKNSPQAIVDSLDCILHRQIDLSNVDLPESMVVYGSHDNPDLLEDIKFLRSKYNYVKFYEIGGANHSVSVSSPHRHEFINLIHNFLD